MTFRVVRPESVEPVPEKPGSGLRLGNAARGVKRGARGSARFFGHLFVATVVVLSALVLGCETWEWAGLTLAVGLVLVTELLNHAIQVIARESRSAAAAESAAGAVLVACGTGFAAAAFILGRRLLAYFGPALS